MISRSFYFIRHGQTDWNKEGRMQGQTDVPLNHTGINQAKKVASSIAKLPIEHICTSTLSRAFNTAEIININNVAITKHTLLCERGFGVIEGKTRKDIISYENNLHDIEIDKGPTSFPCPRNGEPFFDLVNRVTNSINDLLTEHSNKELLFVSHGGVFSALAYTLLNNGSYHKSDNTIPYHFIKGEDGSWTIKNLTTNKNIGE